MNATPEKGIDRIIKSAWFGPAFVFIILGPIVAIVLIGDIARWPYNSYEMYSRPWDPSKYADYHRVAIGEDNGEPIWWKPGFEYQARNLATRLTRAFQIPDETKKYERANEALQYVDRYLSALEPNTNVQNLYIFKREVLPSFQIRDTLIYQIPRDELRND